MDRYQNANRSSSTYPTNKYGAVPMDIEKDLTDESNQGYEGRGMFIRKTRASHIALKLILAFAMLGVFGVLVYLLFAYILFGTIPFGIYGETYDFIVIGAGPAGSVVTNKLVKYGANVLLLEAGDRTQYVFGGTDSFGGPMSRYDIPMMWSSISVNKSVHWTGYNIHGIIQGKGVGGSGIHTAMIYIRALAADLNKWGLKGWDWNRILNQYVSLEDYGNDIYGKTLPSFHGKGGPIQTTKAPFIDVVAPQFIASAMSYGYEYTNDFNDPDHRIGVGYYDFNIRNGLRDSAAGTMLGPLLQSKYFNLQTNAYVRRIILQPVKKSKFSNNDNLDTYRAISVEYEQNGIIKTAHIGKKGISKQGIIVATGALLSPRLLMNSGIGPEEELKQANIEMKVHSPHVGKNAQDHGATQVLFKLKADIVSTYPIAYSVISKWGQYVDAVQRSKSGQKVHTDEYGVLGCSGIAAGGFLVSPYSTDGLPDIQLTVFPTNIFDHGPFSPIKPPSFDGFNLSSHPKIPLSSNVMVIAVALMYPETRFEIKVNYTDPMNSPPHIHATEGKDFDLKEIDLLKMSWGIEQVRQISKIPPLADYVENIIAPSFDITNDMLPEWVLQNHHPYAHWVGSARMGTSIDNSVVDESTKVHSVSDLYITDASIIPLLTNGNIHALVTAVGANAADLIMGENV